MDIGELIKYDEWANQRVFQQITKMPDGSARTEALRLFNHLLAAQIIWTNRIKGNQPSFDIWPSWALEETKRFLNESNSELKALLFQKEREVTYQNSREESFINTVKEILHHLVIHGQHHRAQIAMHVRDTGITPVATDLIFYLRDK